MSGEEEYTPRTVYVQQRAPSALGFCWFLIKVLLLWFVVLPTVVVVIFGLLALFMFPQLTHPTATATPPALEEQHNGPRPPGPYPPAPLHYAKPGGTYNPYH